MARLPETRYAKDPGGNIAYQVVGDGPAPPIAVHDVRHEPVPEQAALGRAGHALRQHAVGDRLDLRALGRRHLGRGVLDLRALGLRHLGRGVLDVRALGRRVPGRGLLDRKVLTGRAQRQ